MKFLKNLFKKKAAPPSRPSITELKKKFKTLMKNEDTLEKYLGLMKLSDEASKGEFVFSSKDKLGEVWLQASDYMYYRSISQKSYSEAREIREKITPLDIIKSKDLEGFLYSRREWEALHQLHYKSVLAMSKEELNEGRVVGAWKIKQEAYILS